MYAFQKILIDQSVEEAPLTRRVREALPDLPMEILPPGFVPAALPIRESKKILYLTRFRGDWIKPCPGTREYVCCGYRILTNASNCPIDCTYCILQAYFNQPYVRLFANLDDLFGQLISYAHKQEGRTIRLGTGEFTDSLALDPLTLFSTLLAEKMAPFPNLVLELKTKSREIGNLMQIQEAGRLVISWSINPENVIRPEEHGAAGLSDRLEAARVCQERGFRLGFHFDPIIYFPGWEEEYRKTIEALFRTIDPAKVVWISLGCFRFIPSLAPVVRQRFPGARFIHEEFIPALDGKMRYPQPRRVEIYRRMVEWITERAGDVGVYLCMENPAVWRRVFGFVPGEEGHPALAEMLDQRALR